MEIIPALEIGLLNGWILLCLLCLMQVIFFTLFPKDVRARLLDRSGWSKTQIAVTVIGKLFVFVCIVLIIFTPLKIGTNVFIIGTILFALGLVGLIIALFNFKNTPSDQPVTGGLYRISRHPQLFMIFILFLGICISIGSWLALLILIISRLFLHFGILGEEKVCLERYGESYLNYMKNVPRYFIFF